MKKEISQADINEKAQAVSDLFIGDSSSLCVLALLSVIEKISTHEMATAAFRKQTADLLDDESFRIKSSLRIGVA